MKNKMVHEGLTLYVEHDSRVINQYEYQKLKKLLKSLLPICSSLITKAPFKIKKSSEVSLSLCGPNKIRTLNREYRNKDKVTDVLSFPHFFDLRTNQDETSFLPHLPLGDVIICVGRAKDQAKNHDIQLSDELIHLFIHGFLHVLGFDHEASKEEEVLMEKWEKKLVKSLRQK